MRKKKLSSYAEVVVPNQKELQELVVVERSERRFANLVIIFTKKTKLVIAVVVCSVLSA